MVRFTNLDQSRAPLDAPPRSRWRHSTPAAQASSVVATGRGEQPRGRPAVALLSLSGRGSQPANALVAALVAERNSANVSGELLRFVPALLAQTSASLGRSGALPPRRWTARSRAKRERSRPHCGAAWLLLWLEPGTRYQRLRRCRSTGHECPGLQAER
jgi:hypothetical protein